MHCCVEAEMRRCEQEFARRAQDHEPLCFVLSCSRFHLNLLTSAEAKRHLLTFDCACTKCLGKCVCLTDLSGAAWLTGPRITVRMAQASVRRQRDFVVRI